MGILRYVVNSNLLFGGLLIMFQTLLSYLVMKNNVTLLEKLLKASELDVNKSDKEGNTPLHFSAQAGKCNHEDDSRLPYYSLVYV